MPMKMTVTIQVESAGQCHCQSKEQETKGAVYIVYPKNSKIKISI